MPNLFELIDREDEIVATVRDFGFGEEIKVYNYGVKEDEEYLLHLILHLEKNDVSSYKIPQFLKAKLQEILSCAVVVLLDSDIAEIYRESIEKNSSPLNNKEAIKKLFGVDGPLKELDAQDKILQPLLLQQAGDYLAKKNCKPESSFLNKGKHNYPFNISEEIEKTKIELKDNLLCFTMPITYLAEEKHSCISPEMASIIIENFSKKLKEITSPDLTTIEKKVTSPKL